MNIVEKTISVQRMAAREYVYSEVYRLQKARKLNAVGASKALKDLLPKAYNLEVKVPQEYFNKWWRQYEDSSDTDS